MSYKESKRFRKEPITRLSVHAVGIIPLKYHTREEIDEAIRTGNNNIGTFVSVSRFFNNGIRLMKYEKVSINVVTNGLSDVRTFTCPAFVISFDRAFRNSLILTSPYTDEQMDLINEYIGTHAKNIREDSNLYFYKLEYVSVNDVNLSLVSGNSELDIIIDSDLDGELSNAVLDAVLDSDVFNSPLSMIHCKTKLLSGYMGKHAIALTGYGKTYKQCEVEKNIFDDDILVGKPNQNMHFRLRDRKGKSRSK